MLESISVIVPVYNVESYVDKCIQSIVGQSFSNLEIILVDDGSTDESGAICDRWAELDDRIRVIHKENGGLSDARNAGIQIANGKYFMFVDSDDTLTLDAVQNLYDAAVLNDCQIAVCNMIRIYDDGTTEPFYTPVQEETVLSGNDRFETLKQPSVCNKLFLSSLFDVIRFPKGKFYEDTFVYHLLVLQAERIVLTGHNGYYYLSRKGSILGQTQYTNRYFDMVESVYHRAVDLDAHQIPYYTEEACLSLYAIVGNCEKYVPKTEANREKITAMRHQYRFAYRYLMNSETVGCKQKIRLLLLRYAPWLHSKLY